MAEIRTIPDKIKTSEIPDSELNTIGKFSKKVIHHNAGAPTVAADTGLGYAVGSIWVDSTNGDTYTCTASTAEDATWINMDGDDVNPPFTAQGSTYGWIAGGAVCPSGSPSVGGLDSITRFSFTAPEAGTAVGELSAAATTPSRGSIRNDTLGLNIGGYRTHPSGANLDKMDSFTFTSPSTVTDIGEYGTTTSHAASTGDGTNGFVMGGDNPSKVDTVTKISLTSPHPMSDNGELTTTRSMNTGFTDLTYAYSVTGSNPPYVDTIDRMAFATTSGTFADSGELTRATGGGGGANGPTKGFYAGGAPPPLSIRHQIDTFTYAAPTTSADVGELAGSHNAYMAGGCASTDYAYFVGGMSPHPSDTATTDTISRIPWSATSGGSTDFGELSNHWPSNGVANANGYESS